MKRFRALLCDLLALSGIALLAFGLYRAWPPAAWFFLGLLLFWAAFILRGRTT